MPRDFATLEPLELQLPLTRVYSLLGISLASIGQVTVLILPYEVSKHLCLR